MCQGEESASHNPDYTLEKAHLESLIKLTKLKTTDRRPFWIFSWQRIVHYEFHMLMKISR